MDKLTRPTSNTLLKPAHHSLSDWDWQPGAYFMLSGDYFISAPTALAIPSDTSGTPRFGWAALKEDLEANIPHGLLTSWHHRAYGGPGYLDFWFRAQALPPSAGQPAFPANCYLLRVSTTYCEVFKRVNNVQTRILNYKMPHGFSYSTWNRHAIYWGTVSGSGGDVCRITLKKEINGQWRTQASVDNSQNLWAGSPVNRVGFTIAGRGQGPKYRTYLDDTEIWKRTY